MMPELSPSDRLRRSECVSSPRNFPFARERAVDDTEAVHLRLTRRNGPNYEISILKGALAGPVVHKQRNQFTRFTTHLASASKFATRTLGRNGCPRTAVNIHNDANFSWFDLKWILAAMAVAFTDPSQGK